MLTTHRAGTQRVVCSFLSLNPLCPTTKWLIWLTQLMSSHDFSLRMAYHKLSSPINPLTFQFSSSVSSSELMIIRISVSQCNIEIKLWNS